MPVRRVGPLTTRGALSAGMRVLSSVLTLRALAQRVEVDTKEVRIMGFEKRAPAHARRRLKRKNGGFWSAQFCTEVASSIGFEPVLPP
jgi:hypothetical protein